MLASSCMTAKDMDFMAPAENGGMERHFIAGQVMDTEGNRLEHIRVTIDWNGEFEKSVQYTASDGSFVAEFPEGAYRTGKTIMLTMDDIDGEENGGLFKSLTDNVIISEGGSSSGVLVYRLNRATPSESSPQP